MSRRAARASSRRSRVLSYLSAAVLCSGTLGLMAACDDAASPVEPKASPSTVATDASVWEDVDVWSLPGAIVADETEDATQQSSSDATTALASVGSASSASLMVAAPSASSLTSSTVPVVSVKPLGSTTVGNCYPFGTNTAWPFMGFIYRSVPAFTLRPGDRLRFDLGNINSQDIRRTIFFAPANKNPGGATGGQDIRATAWTQVVSSTQVPVNPRGNFVVGDYELTYTVEQEFSFPGGGLIIGFRGTADSYHDGGCEQVLVSTTWLDPSGQFYGRFFLHADQTLVRLVVPSGGGLERSWMG